MQQLWLTKKQKRIFIQTSALARTELTRLALFWELGFEENVRGDKRDDLERKLEDNVAFLLEDNGIVGSVTEVQVGVKALIWDTLREPGSEPTFDCESKNRKKTSFIIPSLTFIFNFGFLGNQTKWERRWVFTRVVNGAAIEGIVELPLLLLLLSYVVCW